MTTAISFERHHQLFDFKCLAVELLKIYEVLDKDFSAFMIDPVLRILIKFEFFKLFCRDAEDGSQNIFVLYQSYIWMKKIIEYIKDFFARLFLIQ